MIGESVNEQNKAPIKIFAENKESYFEKETLHISITPTGEINSRLVGHVFSYEMLPHIRN
jgi:NtrC-family two-component system sensor histidine kinase KinB